MSDDVMTRIAVALERLVDQNAGLIRARVKAAKAKRQAIDLSKPESWPDRMNATEISAVLRISRRAFYSRIESGKFPPSLDRRGWKRDLVIDYMNRMREYHTKAERASRRQSLSVVGGGR